MTQRNYRIHIMVTAAICLAICMVLPFLTGQIPQLGQALSPMHIPVLICGFLCGPLYATVVGFAAPVLRFALFGMPAIFPTGLAMCFELAVYGFVSGFMYRKLPKKPFCIYISLICAMLLGRICWGLVSMFIYGITAKPFTFSFFLSCAFIEAIPGIIIHIVLIPILVFILAKALPWLKTYYHN